MNGEYYKNALLEGINKNQYPTKAYKYRPDNDKTQRIITHNELWFSSPVEFNDPYDCNAPIDSDITLEEFNNWFNNHL